MKVLGDHRDCASKNLRALQSSLVAARVAGGAGKA
jgi:hypothetical protein